jgi:hypothetical protein
MNSCGDDATNRYGQYLRRASVRTYPLDCCWMGVCTLGQTGDMARPENPTALGQGCRRRPPRLGSLFYDSDSDGAVGSLKTMKSILIVALAAGALVSTVLLVMEQLTDHSIAVMAWEMPGISAAYLFWGAVGSSVFLGVAIAWTVNAIVYGAAAFVVLVVVKLAIRRLPKWPRNYGDSAGC